PLPAQEDRRRRGGGRMRLFTMAAAGALAAACAAPETAVVSSAPTPAAVPTANAGAQTYAEDLLAYLGRLRSMNESALGAEAGRMKRDARDVARVKAALAMTLSSQGDEAYILELVAP